jgi:Concanavalin A-like lectin/glucanases superfamily
LRALASPSRRWLWALGLSSACAVYDTPPEVSPRAPDDAGSASASGEANAADAGEGATDPPAAGKDAGAGGAVSGGSLGAQAGSGGAVSGGSLGAQAGSGGTVSSGDAGEPGTEPQGGESAAIPPTDLCPEDPEKVAPGYCGCGVSDEPGPTQADCRTLRSLLAHRYDFEGTGTLVQDRVGQADGVIARGATLSNLGGNGVVLLGGGDPGPYVDLPNGLLSSLTSATLEAWVSWGGGAPWQRLFDFGDSTASPPENNAASGRSYLFVTPRGGQGVVTAAYSTEGNGPGKEVTVRGTAPLPQARSQVVVVANAVEDELALYVDGARVGQMPWQGALSQINDVNVWLGRSQFGSDAELNAVYHDFRVYRAALTAAQVAASFKAGPDPQFLAP